MNTVHARLVLQLLDFMSVCLCVYPWPCSQAYSAQATVLCMNDYVISLPWSPHSLVSELLDSEVHEKSSGH